MTIWIPDAPVPCQADPYKWTDDVHRKTGPSKRSELTILRERTVTARDICKTECALRTVCLESAMREEGGVVAKKRFGIRGALLPQERETLHRRRREGKAA